MSHFLEEAEASLLKTQWSGHFSQLRIEVQSGFYHSVKDSFLVEMIHRFWMLKGLIDFKILWSKTSGEILMIWSFQSNEAYNEMLQSEVWNKFQERLNELAFQKKLNVINSIANTYEIIE